MSDEHDDDAKTGNAGESVDRADAAVDSSAEQARPSGKRSSGRRSRTALAEPPSAVVADSDSAPAKRKATERSSRNPFAAVWLFLQQVVTELRKVIWPTRPQMINYTIIVLIFVVVLTALVSLLDLGFAQVILWVFG